MRANKNSNQKKPQRAIPTQAQNKSAEDILIESMGELIDSAAENMSDKEFRKASKRANEILDRALATAKRRRET